MNYSNKTVGYLLDDLANRRNGYQSGLPVKLKKLSKILPGFSHGRIDLVFGDIGNGKSNFVLDFYLMHLFDYVYTYNIKSKTKKLEFDILYFALKDKMDIIYNKCIVWFLKKHLNISVDVNHLRSAGDEKIDKNLLTFIQNNEQFKNYFEAFNKHVKIITNEVSASDIKYEVERLAASKGTTKGKSFTPNNPSYMATIIVDSLDDIKPENGFKRYDLIAEQQEHISNCVSVYSKIYNFHVVNVASTDTRHVFQKAKFNNVGPDISDISNSSLISNSDVVFSLFKPLTYTSYSNKAATWGGYNVSELRDKIRFLALLKNNLGETNKEMALKFEGACNWYSELPPPKSITSPDIKKVMDFFPMNRFWTADQRKTYIEGAVKTFEEKSLFKNKK